MPSKKHKPEEIIGKLREVEIVLGQGGTTAGRKCTFLCCQGRLNISAFEVICLVNVFRQSDSLFRYRRYGDHCRWFPQTQRR